MRGPRGLLPDGLGRQRARDRAPRAELLRRPLRSASSARPGVRAAGEAGQGPDRDLAARTSSSCARDSSRRTSRRSKSCGAGSGLSVDWTLTYTTIGTSARRTSQRAFLRNLARGEAYQADAPTLWDVDMRTAVAQAELEDRELAGAYHALRFHRADGAGDLLIDTTRPELLAACVAVVAHPDDERYQPLFGTEVSTPLYGVSVPVVAHRLADPEKGTGIAMICTFGDVTDVVWWRELQLPTRAIIGVDGRIRAEPPDGRRRRRRERVRGDRGQERQAGAEDRRRAAARVGRARRRAAPDHAPGEVLRARRPAARDRHVAAVVLPQRRPRRRAARRPAAARARAALAPAAHARPLRHVDRRAQLRLAREPAALLRCAVPASGTASAPTARSSTTTRSFPTRPTCPSTRRPTCRPASPPISAGSPAASSRIPT